ncbi:alpha/beta fold hydrolase [Patulibacter sp.]|uniref:lipase family alpha/beta hydrolase n=1 Tax=Patulibacter sp. TaxID=1912859 RepID=UPI0027178FF3|nr:alpha/beta fold hydrolase [Patulibacter sp.]MDO9409059.1 alpha/beta fold hydrolase [Patulibacter sp.]
MPHPFETTGVRARVAVLLSVAAAVLLAPAAAPAATTYAPLDAPGPTLAVPRADLDRSLVCSPGVAGATEDPVLLVPGTTLTPEIDFGWNYARSLPAMGRATCTVELPGNAMGDIQTAGEYVVDAIRTMHRRSGRKVDVVGHSQGGMIGRWALRFWPDVRPMVDDLVGLAPSNHGTTLAPALCALQCAPAFWQQRDTAAFVAALNSRAETVAGVDYTSVFTALDEVVVPNQDATTGSSALRTGEGRRSNVLVQDVCPLHVADHLTLGTSDPVGHALVVDAITHPGPADPGRIDRAAVCARTLAPGVDAATFPAEFARLAAVVAQQVLQAPQVTAEPPLRCYVTASCPAAPAGGTAAPASGTPAARRASRVTLRVRRSGARAVRVTVRLADRAAGRVVLRVARRGARPITRTVAVRRSRTSVAVVSLPRATASRALTVTARFGGDATHRPRTVRARVAAARG